MSKWSKRFSPPVVKVFLSSSICTSKVNIKDRQYTNAIEAFLSGRDFFSFVTQNQEDMEKFLREVNRLLPLCITCTSGW